MGRARPLDGHYEAMDLVSVWIGTFPNEEAFNDYLKENHAATDEDELPKCHFWEDLGIRWHDHDFQEAVFRRDLVSVQELIANISWVESYKTELLERCAELGITQANAAIVICEYDYPPEAGFESPHLNFVGSFRYSTGGYPFRRNPP
jgi:Immunity protein 22